MMQMIQRVDISSPTMRNILACSRAKLQELRLSRAARLNLLANQMPQTPQNVPRLRIEGNACGAECLGERMTKASLRFGRYFVSQPLSSCV
jgi:hypothetical protein